MHKFFRHLTKQQIELGLYAVIMTVVCVAACMVLWYSGGAWLKLWELVGAVVKPLAYGFMLSYVLNPLVTRIGRALRFTKSLAENGERRRLLAVLITTGLVVLVLLGVLVAFAIMLSHGISSLDLQSIEAVIAEAKYDILGFVKMVQERLASWGIISEEGESTLLLAFVNVKNIASTVLFSAIFTIYFLLDGDHLLGYFHRVMFNLLGDHSWAASILLDDADRVFSGYFRGQAIDALIVGVLSGIALAVVGVPYAPVVGLLAGLGNLIPYIGGPVGFGAIVVVCLAENSWVKMAMGLVVMAVVMFVDSNIINPKLLSSNVEVHPMLVVAALIAGGVVGGVAGMLVAVPTAAWLKIQLDRWMDVNEAAHESLFDEIAERINAEDE